MDDLPTGRRKVDKLDLTFLDHHAAFKNKTTWEVLRAYLVFSLCGVQSLVNNNEKVKKGVEKSVFGIGFLRRRNRCVNRRQTTVMHFVFT